MDEDAPLRPRSLYAASKTAQEHYALAWSESTRRFGGGAALSQRLRPRHAARHPVLRGGGDLPFRARKGRAAEGFRGRRPDARLRPRRRRRRGQRRRACARRPAGSSPSMCVRDGRSRSSRWPHCCARPAADRRRWSPGSTAVATFGTSSPTRPGRPELLGFRAADRTRARTAGVRVRAVAGLTASPLRAPLASRVRVHNPESIHCLNVFLTPGAYWAGEDTRSAISSASTFRCSPSATAVTSSPR